MHQLDFAARAHNHNYRMDPIVRSLLDDDFYKFVMQQFILEHFPAAQVEFSLINRAKDVRLADLISLEEMREQLDYARTLRFTTTDIAFMRGQKFYSQEDFFKPHYIKYLEAFQLEDYELGRDDETGQFILRSAGTWHNRMRWEMVFLTITNELKTRACHRKLSKFELVELYARATTKLMTKLRKIADAKLQSLNLTDFGTRRRHSHLWQRFCIEAASEIIGDGFTGTSNVFFAKELGLEAKGTNAHELPMAVAAMQRGAVSHINSDRISSEALRSAQYDVLEKWEQMYPPALWILLPDTFGTTQFLKNAPDWISEWTGARPDSKDPHEAFHELYDFWMSRGQDPSGKLILFSDGLDEDSIINLHRQYAGQMRVAFGWGTNLTNDFKGCYPADPNLYKAISLVAKVTRAGSFGSGQLWPAVKLSDNYSKATGPAEEVEFYRNTFGSEGLANAPVVV